MWYVLFFFRGAFVYASLSFKAKEDPQCCGDALFYQISKKQMSFFPRYVFKQFQTVIMV